MLEGLLIGLQTAFSLQNLLMVIGGCLIGTFIGMLPGLGPMSIIAIMIPVAISMGDPSAALILLAGVYYGAIFGGSTSSILLNAPGVAGTVASSFDGYPMARQGKARRRLIEKNAARGVADHQPCRTCQRAFGQKGQPSQHRNQIHRKCCRQGQRVRICCIKRGAHLIQRHGQRIGCVKVQQARGYGVGGGGLEPIQQHIG